nr:MAG TPA: hypothetical protein [Caudoviricetes sp.]
MTYSCQAKVIIFSLANIQLSLCKTGYEYCYS